MNKIENLLGPLKMCSRFIVSEFIKLQTDRATARGPSGPKNDIDN